MPILLFLLPLLVSFSERAQAKDFYQYRLETQVPEPLYYDLVRSLNSHRGELEVNVLMSQYAGKGRAADFKIAPEIEFVPMDRLGLEFEVPLKGGTAEWYKFAVQYGFDTQDGVYVDGLQFIAQPDADFSSTELSLTYAAGLRLDERNSLFGIFGGRYWDRTKDWVQLVNLNYFYNQSDEIDFGLEINAELFRGEIDWLQVLPQLHLAVNEHYKIQMGMGVQYYGWEWYTTAAFRLIRETNF